MFSENAFSLYRLEATSAEAAEVKAKTLFAKEVKGAKEVYAEVIVEIDQRSTNPLYW